jgi:hypothetical protein
MFGNLPLEVITHLGVHLGFDSVSVRPLRQFARNSAYQRHLLPRGWRPSSMMVMMLCRSTIASAVVGCQGILGRVVDDALRRR